ncbi:MAG: hypothetical protein NT070_01330 [Cyanobacteria bacterium]|nr:hypothetical protein [Cyanobacteriota bacterium]
MRSISVLILSCMELIVRSVKLYCPEHVERYSSPTAVHYGM